MSPQSSSNPASGGPVQKQKLNVYTVMLIIAFAALVIGCLLLWLELRQYGSGRWWDTSGAAWSAPQTPGAPAGPALRA